MIDVSRRIAGVELGGTKCIAVIAQGRNILSREQWPTTNDPGSTLAAVAAWLDLEQAERGFEALGIASFGPLGLDPARADYGQILNTPKPGWSGANVVAALRGKRATLPPKKHGNIPL